jgi:hypothetical protein
LQAQTLLAVAGLLLGGEPGEALRLRLGDALRLLAGAALRLLASAAIGILPGLLRRLDIGHTVGLEVLEFAEGDEG